MFRLKPHELYNLEPIELLEMVEAYAEFKNNTFDEDMNKLAWQTSIIINSMGTLKKKIKPTDLYNPNPNEDLGNGVKVVGKDEHDKLQAELLEAFNC